MFHKSYIMSCFLLLAFTITGCFSRHNVTVSDDKQLFRIQKEIRPDKEYPKTIFSKIKTVLIGRCSNPTILGVGGIAVNTEGETIVSDKISGRLIVYPKDFTDCSKIKTIHHKSIKEPIDLLSYKDTLFVLDRFTKQIVVFNHKFKKINHFDLPFTQSPFHIHQHNDQLFITDPKSNSIFTISFDGALIRSINHINHKELSYPIDLTTSSDGNHYIINGLNREIIVVDSEFQFITQFGNTDKNPSMIVYPKIIDIDFDGHIYINDAVLNTINVFSPDGSLTYSIDDRFFPSGLDPTSFTILNTNQMLIFNQQNSSILIMETHL